MIKKLTLIVFLSFGSHFLQAQLRLPQYADSEFSTYYQQRASLFHELPTKEGAIVFLGNSITDGGEWSELFADKKIKNRGISGDITAGVIHRLKNVVQQKPQKIFLLIGVNDLARGISMDSVVKNILFIADYVHQQLPTAQLFVQSILPVNDAFGKFESHTDKSEQINWVNDKLRQTSAEHGYTFIDLHSAFTDENGKLKAQFTNDGLHLKGNAYLLWKHLVYPYVYGLEKKAALLPLPRQLKWAKGYFPLYKCEYIVVNDTSLTDEAQQLQGYLAQNGLKLAIVDAVENHLPVINLRLGAVESDYLQDEAYKLEITDQNITLIANTGHGIFNGIQTLRQLGRDAAFLDACTITDWPAFSWRGFMVDVGRNYQSIDQLKQQIDVMAQYKLNVFHFHLTENIAWRLASEKYPQLTAPKNMLRDKGKYYTQRDMEELIEYCKKRYITLVPEIDMPGHSDAFTRAIETDMQSDSGMAIMENIIKEFCATYDVPYLHIGGDEVKIKNKEFLPKMAGLVHSLGKKTIGWWPGGNVPQNTIRQLWGSDSTNNPNLTYIDSRHLYLNHMDPLESVTTIYFRRLADKNRGTDNVLGATLCVWNDRAVAEEEDILRMNPVYPGMLAFAERSWRGGGYDHWLANIGAPGTERAKDFAAFEQRLLDHQQQYFQKKAFPYTQQSDIVWDFYGSYENAGKLEQSFAPEKEGFVFEQPDLQQIGGTVILRHWWAPAVKGLLKNPKENTTWYATRKIWSVTDTIASFWIGFNNLSRSYFSDSPKTNTWDNRKSEVWVNSQLLPPPNWQRAGQKGDGEIPLIDEGYSYRAPYRVKLHKGWNRVLIKLPVGSFKSKGWQNPVKWMFTFAPAPIEAL